MLLTISQSREESTKNFPSQKQRKKTFKNHISATAGRSSVKRWFLSPGGERLCREVTQTNTSVRTIKCPGPD